MRLVWLSFGFVEYCVPIANALTEHAEVTLLLPGEDAEPVRDEIDPAVRFLPFRKPRLRDTLRQVRTCSAIVRRVRDLDPDVVHLQQGHLWFNLALPALRRYPLVLTVHDPRHHLGDRASRRTPQWVMDFGFRRASALIVHGDSLREQLLALVRTPVGGVHVVPNLERAGIRRNGMVQSKPDGPPTVLFFGRIWPYKGLDYLIRAQPRIAAEVSDVRIVIAGEGEDFEPYRKLMRNPAAFVVHNEFVSNERREELFTSSDVVVLPYVEATQSAVVAVAYAHARPVVATTVGAIPEIVDDGETGLLVPPRNESALADAVVRVLRDPDLAERLGRNGRRKIARQHSAAAVAAKTFGIYERVLQARSGA